MRRRIGRATRETALPSAPARSASPRSLATQVLALQRQAGNRAVAAALAPPGRGVQRQPDAARAPLAVQRAACEYEARERATAGTARGVLGADVSLLGTIRSGYNAAGNSVVVADFEPGSAVVKDATRRELGGSWVGILERPSAPSYAVLGFTDCVGDERENQTLRANRAHAVAAMLPNATRRASVIGAAPATDFLMPTNATPSERALNRSVLLWLPFEELRQSAEIDEYGADAVQFWRSNPAATVDQLITHVTRQVGALLERNGVPLPEVIKGKAPAGATLAFFEAKSWSITIDEQKMAAASSQHGLTPSSKLSTLTIDAVAELGSGCYHEFRHAEQAFLAARLTAEEAKGDIEPRELAQELGIPLDVAGPAISASGTVLPDKLKVQARAWRTMQHGGRYLDYKQWNDSLSAGLALFNREIKWDELGSRPPGSIRTSWENLLHPVIDQTFRRNYSFRGDKLMKDMSADPHHDPVDEQTRKALTQTTTKLFMALAKERGGKDLPGPDAIARMDADEAKLAHLSEQIWLEELHIALMEAQTAAEDAYRAYPEEAEAYQVQDLVKASIKEHQP